MRIAIIGAGFVGLTAAYRLVKAGHQVEIFEKEKYIGGLSATFRENGWQWPLETFYHHLFTTDENLKKLLKELGIEDKLKYYQPKTSIFIKNKILQFDSPLTVLKFPYLSLLDRVRTGFLTLLIRTIVPWQILEKEKASVWLKRFYGENVYKILWEPLLISKFGEDKDEIGMAWFWSRIKKRSLKLGYLDGSIQTLTDRLILEIKKNKGKINLDSPIKNLSELRSFDKILVTTSTEIFTQLTDDLPKDYLQKIQKLKTIATLNLILVLKDNFFNDKTYWLNINENNYPFVAVVEHTNFIDSKHYDNKTILYLGGYYPKNHRYFKMKKEDLLKEFMPYLQKINPNFNTNSIITHSLFTNLFAQPIVPVNYSKMIPEFKTPLENIYLANMQQVYPWDREINYAIEEGEKVASEILKS